MAVVGPVPEGAAERVPFSSLEGARVAMPEAWEAFGKKPSVAEQRVTRLAKERAEAIEAAGWAPPAVVATK
jgi:hypothetical protein